MLCDADEWRNKLSKNNKKDKVADIVDNEEETQAEEKIKDDNNQDIDDVENCLSVEETKTFVLNNFHNNIKERECKQVVFFYSQKNLEKARGKIALNRMSALNDFVVYKKDTLLQALKEFIDTH